jgi:HEAT repeat protein
MADEAPKLIQIGKGDPAPKKDGFNLISERVVKVDLEARTMEIELLAYEGKTVVLEVGEDLLEELKQLKPGDGVTVRVIEEEPGVGVQGTLHSGTAKRRIVKSFTIRSRDANKTRAEEMLSALKESHWLTRKYAVEVLGSLGDARAVGPLIEVLTDEVNDIRQRAYDSLIKIGAPSVPAVASLLTHEDDDLRQAASEIIRKIGKPAVEPLTDVMLGADEALQAKIRKLLDRMGYKPKPKTEVM